MVVHACNLSAPTVRWEVETGELLEAGGPTSREYTVVNKGKSASHKVGREDGQLSGPHQHTCPPPHTLLAPYLRHSANVEYKLHN